MLDSVGKIITFTVGEQTRRLLVTDVEWQHSPFDGVTTTIKATVVGEDATSMYPSIEESQLPPEPKPFIRTNKRKLEL